MRLVERLRRMFGWRRPDPEAGRLAAAADALDRRTRTAVTRAERAIRESERIDREMQSSESALRRSRPWTV